MPKRSNIFLDKYHTAKVHARVRNVPFLLTFDQWKDIWVRSGRWEQRGCRRGQYVMARFGDRGAYEVGNIKIILATENNSEGHKGKVLSAETKAKVGAAQKGKTISPEHKAAIAAAGRRRWRAFYDQKN